MKVRGHHLACVYCFKGSGKETAEEFFKVSNAIPALLAKLRADPELAITVVANLDEVCDVCPLKAPTGCGRGEDPAAQNRKLCRWDEAILRRLGLKPGDNITARQLEQRLRGRIPDVGEVCANCSSAAAGGWREYRRAIEEGLWPEDGLGPARKQPREARSAKDAHNGCQPA